MVLLKSGHGRKSKTRIFAMGKSVGSNMSDGTPNRLKDSFLNKILQTSGGIIISGSTNCMLKMLEKAKRDHLAWRLRSIRKYIIEQPPTNGKKQQRHFANI